MNGKILIVDEDPAVLDALKREIEWQEKPVKIFLADSLNEAKKLINKKSYDLVFIGENKASTDGEKFLSEMENKLSKTAKVYMSYDAEESRIQDQDDPKNKMCCISKPWLRSDIKTLIERL